MLQVVKQPLSLVSRPARPRPTFRCHSLTHNGLDRLSWSSFPFTDEFDLDGVKVDSNVIFEHLSSTISEERLKKIDRVVKGRTFSVLPIAEGVYDIGNLAAVCRSADALGYGAVHCIKGRDARYKKSQRTSAGAEKWLECRVWDDTQQGLQAIKNAGYKVVVANLDPQAVPVSEVDWTQPTAIVLGNEKRGVSDTALAMADQHMVIPMTGFVDSFNISVAAALVLYEAHQQRVRRLGAQGDLTEAQQQILRATYLLRSVKHGKNLLRDLLHRPPPQWQAHHFKNWAQETMTSSAA